MAAKKKKEREEKKNPAVCEEFHMPTWQLSAALSAPLPPRSRLLSSCSSYHSPPLFIWRTSDKASYYEILLSSAEGRDEKKPSETKPAVHFISLVQVRSGAEGSLSGYFRKGAVAAAAACSCCCCLGCCSFGCDRLRLQHVETGSTLLLWHRLWFVCTSCWLVAKRRSRVKCEEQRDYYNLTPDHLPMLCLFSKVLFFVELRCMIKNKQIKFYEFPIIIIFIPWFTVAFWIVCPLSVLTHGGQHWGGLRGRS